MTGKEGKEEKLGELRFVLAKLRNFESFSSPGDLFQFFILVFSRGV